MQVTANYKKAIDSYHATLADLRGKGGINELHLRPAFHNLLVSVSKKVGWTLVPEQRLANGRVPDGTLRDAFLLPRGYWEAKDTADELDVEIKRKIDAGYPLTNIIFEDTHRAVLYQDGQRKLEVDLTQIQQVTDLLHAFTTHAEPDIEEFEQAVAEFKARIPELAQGVLQIIAKERKENRRFVAAFGAFHELCKTALDPRISESQIDEMLVQHLLTERLFRTVFDNQDFTRRNAIASEIENVIDALTSRAFNRAEFLKTLDRFYVAIEDTARGLGDFSEKQHFLNVVYERFFQGFSVKQADTMGIVYTPQEIVDFMCASVEEVLQREFGKSLSTPGVKILDPCVGTGNFIVNILSRINRRNLKRKYAEDLFCNEIMLLPYYIASLNIEHEYFRLTDEYAPFEGICFTDTLDLAEAKQLGLFSEENTARVAREKDAEITVIIGNPPYNVGQQNENDNNRNRRYEVIDKRIRDTYAKDSKATNKNALSDAYVKFFRWATDRLQRRDGIVCFVSNNGFLRGIAFDGFRKHLMSDYTSVYHLDFKGNAHTSGERRQREGGNIFNDQIRVGVGITLLVRNQSAARRMIAYNAVCDYWRGEKKMTYLRSLTDLQSVPFRPLIPDANNTWLTEGLDDVFSTFTALGSKEGKAASVVEPETVFRVYGGGVKTNRDEWAYSFDIESLKEKATRFIINYNGEVDRWLRRSDRSIGVDDFVTYDDSLIKWSASLKSFLERGKYAEYQDDKCYSVLYRPFSKQYLIYDRLFVERVYQFPQFIPNHLSANENMIIAVNGIGNPGSFRCLLARGVVDLHLVGDTQCFPFYTYNEDGTNRRENITDWALAQFREKYGDGVSKWDIFYYVYALLHHPVYRERYTENLKRELPRIPLTVSPEDFPAYAEIGRKLADLHLNYETIKEYPLKWIENNEIPFSWRVEKMRLSKDKSTLVVNDSLTLTGFPSECFDYRLGNRSALEWVIDQYQVSTDKRSGITSDPNRADDPEYIIRLLGRVVTVSVETVQLIHALPDLGVSETLFPKPADVASE
ncbi:MAG: N-6 DNA methylase [Armatimonadetes bacterium]|nr:N-6 DNA methylase [Armatimonadota bacterium]